MEEPSEIIGWIKNKQITKILAQDVNYEANSKWFNCLSVKLQYLPSIMQHIKISYDWNEIEEIELYKLHKLDVTTSTLAEAKKEGYNFSINFSSKFIVKKITLFGGEISISSEVNFKELNIVLFESEVQKILIVPEEYTSRVLLTTDEMEINGFLTNLAIDSHERINFLQSEI